MADDAPLKQYGDVTIGGNAVVQMGDRQVTNKNEINIQTAYLFLQDEIDLPNLNIIKALPSQSLEKACQDGAMSLKNPNTSQANRFSRDYKKRLQSLQQRVSSPGASCSNRSLIPRANSREITLSTLEQKDGVSRTLDHLRRLVAMPGQQDTRLREDSSISNVHPENELQTSNKSSAGTVVQSGQEFLALFAFAMSLLIGRNASSQDVSALVTKCQHDPLLPVLTATIAFGIARYLYTGQVLQNPSCMDELKIRLEDAYGIPTLVSMSVCADYSIFKSFLEVHYRKAGRNAGEQLVKSDQFHLMLGSRRGMLMSADNWTIEPGSNIINSLYIATEESKCLLCKNTLVVSKTGDLHCLECKIFFRDYDILSPPQPVVKQRLSRAPLTPKENSASLWQGYNPDYVEYLDETQIELEGLRHIDLRIVPRRPRPTNAGVLDAEEDTFQDGGQPNNETYSTAVHFDSELIHESDAQLTGPSRLFWEDYEHRQQSATPFQNSMDSTSQSAQKGILKPPRKEPFPEDPTPIREGVAPLPDSTLAQQVPSWARWTKINRKLVNPEALELAAERFEEREDSVIVLRVLSRAEIERLAEVTAEIRKEKDKREELKRARHESLANVRRKRTQARSRKHEETREHFDHGIGKDKTRNNNETVVEENGFEYGGSSVKARWYRS